MSGSPASVFSDPDQPHSWAAVDDVAATLAVLGGDERAWGSPWVVPSNPPQSMREVLRELNRRVGLGEPTVRQVLDETAPAWHARLRQR